MSSNDKEQKKKKCETKQWSVKKKLIIYQFAYFHTLSLKVQHFFEQFMINGPLGQNTAEEATMYVFRENDCYPASS